MIEIAIAHRSTWYMGWRNPYYQGGGVSKYIIYKSYLVNYH